MPERFLVLQVSTRYLTITGAFRIYSEVLSGKYREYMSHDQPLLTIAIPTYNRYGCLDKLLGVLFDQLKNEDRVELIVSDNASTDETSLVIARYQDKGLNVRYIQNAINIGADANFLQCFDVSRGKYLWIFGDDDIIMPGTLKNVIDKLAAHDFTLVYLTPFGFHHDFIAEKKNIRPWNKWHKTQIVRDPVKFSRLVAHHGDFLFLSTIIVNKNAISNLEHPPFTCLNETNVLQLSWVFTALSIFQYGLFVQSGTVAAATTNAHYPFNAAKVFGINYCRAVELFIGTNSRLGKALINEHLFFWFSKFWIGIRRERGARTVEYADAILRPLFYKNVWYWFIIFPLIKLPFRLALFWSRCLLIPRCLRSLL